MKIGTSLSRCVKDIVTGEVDKYEVMVIISRTDVNPDDDKEWASIWRGYTNLSYSAIVNHWQDHVTQEDEFRDVCKWLKSTGRLHQPRQFGAHPMITSDYWYDLILTAETHENNPAIKKSYENYKMLAGLL